MFVLVMHCGLLVVVSGFTFGFRWFSVRPFFWVGLTKTWRPPSREGARLNGHVDGNLECNLEHVGPRGSWLVYTTSCTTSQELT